MDLSMYARDHSLGGLIDAYRATPAREQRRAAARINIKTLL